MKIFLTFIIVLVVFIPVTHVQAIHKRNWQTIFTGYGSVEIHKQRMYLKPKMSTQAEETHAALVVGPEKHYPIKYQVTVKTLEQLRQNSPAASWEVGWVIWNYQDNEHFYYFIPKPNGWELGKRDPAYDGGQRFLATGSDTVFPINKKYKITIYQYKKKMVVYVNHKKIVEFTDNEEPYSSGRVGVYSEDAEVRYHHIKIVHL